MTGVCHYIKNIYSISYNKSGYSVDAETLNLGSDLRDSDGLAILPFFS